MEVINSPYEPNISDSLSKGWETLKNDFLWLFLAIIVSGIFQSPTRYTFDNTDHINFGMVFLMMFGLAFAILISPVIKYGAKMMFLQAVRREDVDVKWLVKGFQTNYLNIILASLLHFACVAVGFIFFIIPGIIIACRLSFVPYLVMDKDMDPVKAVDSSWKMTRGYGWTIFGLAIISIFIFFLGLICLLVGVIPALIWIQASFTSLYQSILLRNDII